MDFRPNRDDFPATSIAVVGDTQGRFDPVTLVNLILPHLQGADEIWHAGDWQHPELLELLARHAPLVVVNGNAPDDPTYPQRVVREVGGHRLAMVHRPPAPDEPWLAGVELVIFGHTHAWTDERIGPLRMVNVGSATGAWSSGAKTMGRLDFHGHEIRLKRIELD